MNHIVAIPEQLPISDLRQRQHEILERLHNGPIVLTQRGRGAGVLVGNEDWNALIAELEDLRDALDVVEAREEFRRNPASARSVQHVETDLIAEGLLDG